MRNIANSQWSKCGLRHFSKPTSVMPLTPNTQIAHIPRGTGGRSSYAGRNVVIFGSTGFVARYLVNELGRTGHSIVAVTRGDDMSWRHLKPLTDYGKLTPHYFDMRDEKSVKQAIEGADVVVNLQGKYYETKHLLPWNINWKFEDLHIDAARKLAKFSRQMGVGHFVHMSTTGYDTPPLNGKLSEWARTKKLGDKAVMEEFPGATLVKSNIIYGEDDRFLNLFASLAKNVPYIPLVHQGAAKLRPVFVGDVADALATIVQNPYETCGNTYSLNGADIYTYKEVFEYVAHQIHRRQLKFIDLPDKVAEMVGFAFQQLPSPIFTQDGFELMKADQLGDQQGELTFSDLGIKPEKFEVKAFNYLYKFRAGGHFADPRSQHVIQHR